MAGKRDKPEDVVLKLRQVEVLQGQGMGVCCAATSLLRSCHLSCCVRHGMRTKQQCAQLLRNTTGRRLIKPRVQRQNPIKCVNQRFEPCAHLCRAFGVHPPIEAVRVSHARNHCANTPQTLRRARQQGHRQRRDRQTAVSAGRNAQALCAPVGGPRSHRRTVRANRDFQNQNHSRCADRAGKTADPVQHPARTAYHLGIVAEL
jgi:hypothetical protein